MNITREYNRINELFEYTEEGCSVRDMAGDAFLLFPKSFRGRTISLDDFEETFKLRRKISSVEVSLEELLLLCEYISNLCVLVKKHYYCLAHKLYLFQIYHQLHYLKHDDKYNLFQI